MVQYPRIYNPEKQRRRYDPNGAYVKQWIPDLAQVPLASWDAMRVAESQLALPLFGHERYPHPVVDHNAAARSFLARYQEYLTDSSTADRRARR